MLVDTISLSQNAFIGGRDILDAALGSNEVVDYATVEKRVAGVQIIFWESE